VEEITANHIKEREADRNVPALRQLTRRPSPKEIIDKVNNMIVENEKLARRVSIHICHKYSGAKLREIGILFDVQETAITESSRRLLLRMEEDKKLRELVSRVRTTLNI
jgi:uncharacterized protein (UPF0128 family)